MNFDLDIHNYTKDDLEDLLDLKYPYQSEDINSKCSVFQESVLNNSNLDQVLSSRVTSFLDQVKIKLVSVNNNSNNNDLLSHKNFENPRLPNSKVLQVGNTQIIEQNLRNTKLAETPSSSMLSSNLSYTLDGNQAPGKMNPLYKRTLTKSLTIDSRFRDNYYTTKSSDFGVTLPTSFNNVVEIQLSELELPLTFYAISKEQGNNYFWIRMVVNDKNKGFFNKDKWITENDQLKKNDIAYSLITIPDGNYISMDLTKYINQVFSTLFTPLGSGGEKHAEFIKIVIDINSGGSGSGRTIFSSTSYTFESPSSNQSVVGKLKDDTNVLGDQTTDSVPAAANRFEINFSAGFPMKKNLTFSEAQDIYNHVDTTPLPLKFGWILGFRNTLYTSFNRLTDPVPESMSTDSDDTTLGSTYISEGFFECHGPRYLFLVVDDYNNNVNNGLFSAFNSSIMNKNVLARISIKGTVFSILSDNAYHVTCPPREYFGPVNIDKLRIQLLDEYGRVIDTNNMDYSIALNIKSVYDK